MANLLQNHIAVVTGAGSGIGRAIAAGMCKAATSFGVKHCERLFFVSINVHAGPHRTNVFAFTDGWRTVDAVEATRRIQLAKLPKPQRAAVPKPVMPPKVRPERQVRSRTMQRATPSLPHLRWLDAGR